MTHKPACDVHVGPANILVGARSLRRYFEIEREFHLVTARMAACPDAAYLSQLSHHREGIIVEARGILHKLDILEPSWCLAK